MKGKILFVICILLGLTATYSQADLAHRLNNEPTLEPEPERVLMCTLAGLRKNRTIINHGMDTLLDGCWFEYEYKN